MLQMSVDPQPVNLGSRIVTSTWLLFVMVIVSSYTANLTVFLGAKSDTTPFQNLTQVKFLCKLLSCSNVLKILSKYIGKIRFFFTFGKRKVNITISLPSEL